VIELMSVNLAEWRG